MDGQFTWTYVFFEHGCIAEQLELTDIGGLSYVSDMGALQAYSNKTNLQGYDALSYARGY
jgi:hypothetical protein